MWISDWSEIRVDVNLDSQNSNPWTNYLDIPILGWNLCGGLGHL